MSALRDLVWDAIKQADKILLALCIAASSYGIILLYSASRYKVILHKMPVKQAVFMLVGIVVYFAVSQFNIDVLRQKWKFTLFLSFFIMALLKTPLGVNVKGNTAWLGIPHVPITVQPAEFNKIFFAIILAHLLVYLKRQKRLNHPVSIMMIGSVIAYYAGIVVVFSKDFGSALIFVVIFVFMVWASGISKIWFGLGVAAVAAAVRVVWPMIPNDELHKKRILILFDHGLDPYGTGMQQTASLNAISSGGVFGRGYMKGFFTQHSNGSRLPERTSDFIFSTCCEEWGLIGAAIVILLLMAILLRILYIGLQCNDSFHGLVCMGFCGMFFAQIGFNLGMCLYVMPVIGVTLPFFSGGGTSLVVNFMIMGLVSGIRSRSDPEWVRNTEAPEITPPPQPQRKSVLYTPGHKRRVKR